MGLMFSIYFILNKIQIGVLSFKKFEQRWKNTTSFRVVHQYNYKIATRSAVSLTLWFAKHPTQLSRSIYGAPDKTVQKSFTTYLVFT